MYVIFRTYRQGTLHFDYSKHTSTIIDTPLSTNGEQQLFEPHHLHTSNY